MVIFANDGLFTCRFCLFFLLRAHAVHSAMHLLANEMEYKALDDEI